MFIIIVEFISYLHLYE